MATFLGILCVILLIDLPPLIVIDGWIGRYPPAMEKVDNEDENVDEKPRLQQRLRQLRIFYIIVDNLYILVALLLLALWIYTDLSVWGWSDHYTRVLLMSYLYILALWLAVNILVIQNSRELTGKCFPYYLGVSIVRIIRFVYKKTGRLDNYVHGKEIHHYIWT